MKSYIALALLMVSTGSHALQGDLYVYPAGNQDTATIERDRYECYVWAARESGFDPSKSEMLDEQQLVKVPENPHRGATGKGVLLGAIAGVALDDSRDGAAIGAVIGSIAGAIVENNGRREAEQIARNEAFDIAAREQQLNKDNADYRRAFSACLEGRGYVVR